MIREAAMNTESDKSQEPSRAEPLNLPDELVADDSWTGAERRKHPRVRFRRVVRVRIEDAPPANEIGDSVECQVDAETLSTGGISFITRSKIEQKELQIALDLSDGSILWFHAEIVRSQPLADGSGWEFGAAFRGMTSFEA